MEKLLQFWDVIPFGREAAETYAELTMRYPNRKASFDRLIAAHAIALNVVLVTNNPADFVIYQPARLKLENWAA